MIFAVDIGNSNIVIGCCTDKILFSGRLSTNHAATELEYAIFFKNILEMHGIGTEDIKGSIISSVVPSLTNIVKGAITKITDTETIIVGPGIKTGLSIMTDNPAQVGSDLVVDAVAGINQYSLPLVIIDMGTATTVSVVDENENYTGTIIMPGMKVSLDSLVGKTSQLPKIGFDKPRSIIGKNTVEAMKSGILYSTASSIDGIISRIEDELKKSVTAVATGGLADTVIPMCRRDIIIDNELLLKGLIIIYSKNKGSC